MYQIGNENTEHKALIRVIVEVHEIHPLSGEFMGMPVELRQDKQGMPIVKENRIFVISAPDKFACIKKLNEFLQELQNKCQQ